MRRLCTTGRLRASAAIRLRTRRSFWLWVCALWLLSLGIASVWRGVVLWQMRTLLAELQGRLSPAGLWFFTSLFLFCGLGLGVSAVALWLRRGWATWCAPAFIGCYMVAVQTYVWLAVQSGLLWERRWVSLTLSILGLVLGIGALSWRVSRRWLGLRT